MQGCFFSPGGFFPIPWCCQDLCHATNCTTGKNWPFSPYLHIKPHWILPVSLKPYWHNTPMLQQLLHRSCLLFPGLTRFLLLCPQNRAVREALRNFFIPATAGKTARRCSHVSVQELLKNLWKLSGFFFPSQSKPYVSVCVKAVYHYSQTQSLCSISRKSL